jgi:hypothetical protein
MAERVARRHRTEENVDAIPVVAVDDDVVVPVDDPKGLSNKAMNVLFKGESCVLCGHKAGRTNKRHHFAAKHAEINSDDHPTVRARLQAIAQAPPILSSFASAPKAKPVTIRAVEFFAAHGIPHQVIESVYFRQLCHGISMHGDQDLVKSRKTFATRTDEHSAAVLQQQLQARAGMAGFLSIDSGTVVHRYLCAVLHTPRARPIVVACIADAAFDDGSLSTANIIGGINAAADACATHKISIGAVVTDNCANIAKAAAECGRIPVRCLAHSIQLVVKDALNTVAWQGIVDSYEAAHALNPSVPGRCETRWSWLYFGVEKILKLNELGEFMAPNNFWTQLEKLATAVKVLKVFYDATQQLQGSGANGLTALRVVAEMSVLVAESNPALSSKYREPFRVALESRIKTFFICEDWMCVLAYFHPSCNRSAVPDTVLTLVGSFINEYGELTVSPLEGPRAPGMRDLTGDFNDSLVHPPARSTEDDHNITSYILYWSKARLPRLCAFLRVLVALPPTEAEVERAFSKLKRMVPRLRVNLSADRAASSLILMSLLEGEDDESQQDSTDYAKLAADDKVVSAQAAERVIRLYNDAHGAERQERGKETRSRTMTCLRCKKHLSEHASADAFTCKGACQRRCATECSDIHPTRWEVARTVYRCPECART